MLCVWAVPCCAAEPLADSPQVEDLLALVLVPPSPLVSAALAFFLVNFSLNVARAPRSPQGTRNQILDVEDLHVRHVRQCHRHPK